MRRRLARLVPAIAALAVALVACGDVGDPGVAATVNGEAIPRSLLEDRWETVASNSQVAQQLQRDTTGQLRGRVQAQILTELIASTLVRQGAAELGVELDDADVAAQRERLAQQVGGEDALQQAIARQGLSEDDVRRLLRDRAYRRAITAELVGGGEAAGQRGSQAFTRWLTQRRDRAEIDVNPEFGRWDPDAGAVVAEVADADAATSGQAGAARASPASGAGDGAGQGAGQSADGADASAPRDGGPR